MENLYSEIDSIGAVLRDASSRKQLLTEEINEIIENISTTSDTLDTIEGAIIFLQKVSDNARLAAKQQIERIITEALQYVYGTSYSFEIDLRYGSKVSAEFLVVTKRGNRILKTPPESHKGGGIVDLLAVALKFALLELTDTQGILWLDEPFKFVSEKYIEDAGRLLEFINKTAHRPIVMITHIAPLANMCDNVLLVTQNNSGYSTVSTI